MSAAPSAVFLDRDGTIIEDAHYLSDPRHVRLLDGAAEAIARVNSQLIPVIVVTNQSGIGRGIFTQADHVRVTARLDELLAERGARVDASYHCPHSPEDECLCRKPGTLLFERAANDFPGIELNRALYAGDRMRDIEPGIVLGGSAVLVPSDATPESELIRAREHARIAESLAGAIDLYLCAS